MQSTKSKYKSNKNRKRALRLKQSNIYVPAPQMGFDGRFAPISIDLRTTNQSIAAKAASFVRNMFRSRKS